MGKFDGKKLLILGTNVASVDIVKYARSEGAYVIVTDYLPEEKSEAKQHADETAMISTLDVEALIRFGREKKIDGVFCGVSEANLLSVRAVSEALGLPCYFTKEQWDILQNKKSFSDSCIQYGITCPREFQYEDMNIDFPVIVKPVDGSASLGITICYDMDELGLAVDLAKNNSKSRKAIIEEYIQKDEIMVYYTIIDGEIVLSAMCDRYMKKYDDNTTQLPVGYSYPSKYLIDYIDRHDKKVRNYISGIGIKNGLLAFQAFMDGVNFIPFDPTYRLDGTVAYNFVEHENKVNIMKQLVNYQLIGTMGDSRALLDMEDPQFRAKCYEFPVLLTAGTITEVAGMEKIEAMEDVIYISKIRKTGDVLKERCHFTQIFCRILLCAADEKKLMQDIKIIKETLRILDEWGNNMILNI